MDEKLTREIANSPEWQANQRRKCQMITEEMRTQSYYCKFATVTAERNLNQVKIGWELKPGFITANFHVSLNIYRIDFKPNPDLLPSKNLFSGTGNGSVAQQLPEGCAFHFEFYIWDRKWAEEGLWTSNSSGMESLTFQIAIPMPQENLLLLEKAKTVELKPADKIRHDFEMFYQKQDAVHAGYEIGIARIKARNLPPDEEARMINELLEMVDFKKESIGL